MALWLRGRLLDCEREGLLDADPNALTGTMLGHMRETPKLTGKMDPAAIAKHLGIARSTVYRLLGSAQAA